ncbi:MAG TPA: FGGY-family carbohydrate kinase, partial [Pyrinomonadaceae bacterium]|nr:FGGY-family carbohydrate kinase [Pyrinomonadaceae bacterium]
QFQNFNTLFQLYSEGEDLDKADKLLLLPDLINFFLTGRVAAEYTNATTTQMVKAASGSWCLHLLEELDLPARLLPAIISAGTDIGNLKTEIEHETALPDVRVIAPATHDTGSAIAGAPLDKNWAYISSGTWSLIGIELNAPLINAEAARHNFTNEGGAYGLIRFLKNVMGLWIFESCRREWEANGIDANYDAIIAEVAEKPDLGTFIFADDARFLNPPSMLAAIGQQLHETGQNFDERPAAVAKVIFDSLALRYASVLRSIDLLTGRKLEGIQILGGGGHNRYLNQLTADASGLPARAGLVEATVVGNVLVQAIAAGRFDSLAEARRHVADNFKFEEFAPQSSSKLDEATKRYAEIEARFGS